MKKLEKFVNDTILANKRKDLNKTVFKATYKAQKLYEFEMGTGEHAT